MSGGQASGVRQAAPDMAPPTGRIATSSTTRRRSLTSQTNAPNSNPEPGLCRGATFIRRRCRRNRTSTPEWEMMAKRRILWQDLGVREGMVKKQLLLQPLHRARAKRGEYTIHCLNLAADLSTAYAGTSIDERTVRGG